MGAPVFLCGMMGSGKSSVGRIAADRLSVAFVDLDMRIERMFGETVASLFGAGEPRFRALERQALRSLLAEPSFPRRAVIVATGGGTIVDPLNRAAMDAVGRRFFLDVPIDRLVCRLGSNRARGVRPLVAQSCNDEDLARRLMALWHAREAAYLEGAVTIDADAEPGAVAERLIVALDLPPQVGVPRE